jgi:hypothetical protein
MEQNILCFLLNLSQKLNSLNSTIKAKVRNTFIGTTQIGNHLKTTVIPSTSIPTPEAVDMPLASHDKNYKQPSYSCPEVYLTTLDNIIFYARYESIFTSSRQLINDSVHQNKILDKYSLTGQS